MISHLGAMLPVACGLALASQLRGDKRVAAAFTGDGATSEGDFHEALNLAGVWKLPVIFVIENNQWGLSTPVQEQYACRHLADRGIGYGMPGQAVDGNDLLSVVRAVRRAAERGRRGDGPTLLEFKTYRMRGHEEASGVEYVPKQRARDVGEEGPGQALRELPARAGALRGSRFHRAARGLQAGDRRARRRRARGARAELERRAGARRRVRAGPGRGEARGSRSRTGAGAEERRYVDAVSDGLRVAMRRDARVVLLGQDIAEYGGVFKVTAGFAEEFGKARVRNTPIIESGAVGCALGLALDGLVPMVEMQFGDFISCGFNQIVNNLAKTHWRWGAGVPVVIRGADRRRHRRGAVPLAERRGLVHRRGGAEGGRARDAVRRQGPADRRVRGRQPGRSTWSTSCSTARRRARCRPATTRYRSERRASRAKAADATVVSYGAGVAWALEAAEALASEGPRSR